MIDKDEIKKVIETIDALKILQMKGEKEKREYGRISLIWGIGIGLIFIYYGFNFRFLGELFWLYDIYVCSFFHFVKISGFVISFIYWGSAFFITTIIYFFTKNYSFLLFFYVLISTFGYLILYNFGIKKEVLKDFVPFKISIGSKIGLTWGLITMGMGISFYSILKILIKNNINIDFSFLFLILFGYVMGVGIFISGLIENMFFIIGLIGIFGIPILTLINLKLGYLTASIVSFLCAIVGLKIYLRREKWTM